MKTLRQTLKDTAGLESRTLWGARETAPMRAIAYGESLGGRGAALAGRSVLIQTTDQFSAALALIALDGVAKRMILCPPDLAEDHLPAVIRDGQVEAVVWEGERVPAAFSDLPQVRLTPPQGDDVQGSLPAIPTEWVLFTSGTTGAPKMVIHDLAALTGAIKPMAAADRPIVWATFYDIRRYGGLQILLRGLLSGGSMVVSSADEPMADLLARMGRVGVTHVSGTPSHWRKALASDAAQAIAPLYVRLSGEIADQAILDKLKDAFPGAKVGHAYASTEAGVGFEVLDGKEGFSADLLDRPGGEVDMKVVDGSLRIRSRRTASRYIGAASAVLADPDGFVDTGDMIEVRDGRCYFAGRRGGIINVGGLKVHPEEIEAVINGYPGVRLSLAYGRRNAITGAIVVAEVVLEPDIAAASESSVRQALLDYCRGRLAPYKVPASLRFVSQLSMTAGGKLFREPT